ncbi:hypothetical protein EMIHUDRAFT_245039 [Emiliania huxleyi CCMP1516]|uniref:SNF2 N-terminal domain-containing protein n=2 Tax=Emiliania huxleyi TaxID=2903 RepID=A0A0D3IZ12_EMIH1|nr:hypothetical protein EMIHUDRAFT_245039 [Emiliania huxleyi CCMP1516]EOD16497.1 hypothetical protein EMIHUDRAFT_245039 [Emiliania huxleyi CCMP1516]|eukprot:XP_005768926.1 hypothetical protein EMIHUDRAFT_245039 [Emiliania huxleyi CCMP1516]
MRSPAAASAAALSAGEEVLEDDDLLRIILSALAPVGDPSSATADALRTAAALSKRWSALVKPITRRYLLSRAEADVLALPTYGIPPGSFAKVMEFASFLNGRRRGRSCGLPEHIARSAFPESLSVPPAFAPGVSDATALGATQLITSFECGGIPALVEGDGGAEKVIACLTHFATKQMVDYLVICPSGRMQLWVSALQQLAPSIRVLVNQGTPTQRKNALLSQPRDYDLLLTPYSLAIKDTLHLCKLRWKVVVWDDGLSELRRGFREGSQTWALHQGVNKWAAGASGGRRATDYNILLSPARVTNADDLLWLVHNHLGATYAACKVGLDAHAIAMRVIVQKLGLLEIAPASLCTEGPLVHATGKGWVKGHKGQYYDALHVKNGIVKICLVESLGGIAPPTKRIIFNFAKEVGSPSAVDRTDYGTASGSARGFVQHHSQQLSRAAVCGDSQNINNAARNMRLQTNELDHYTPVLHIQDMQRWHKVNAKVGFEPVTTPVWVFCAESNCGIRTRDPMQPAVLRRCIIHFMPPLHIPGYATVA